ncbi:MAG TPA: hypothetical protein VLE22_28155 [Bryobacteraceae bacterium]|nr:hypothetical protein [Bryobacteraceae bacterium]
MKISTLAVLLCASLPCSASAPQQLKVANEFVERVFEIRDGKVRTTALVNKLDRRVYAMDSEEFELSVVWERIGYQHGDENPVRLMASDFTLGEFEQKAGPGGEQQLIFPMTYRRFALEVRMVVSLGPEDAWVRKHLEIRATGRERVFLDRIIVESFTLRGLEPRLGGFGQPLYADNVFFGIEYPASYNTAEGRKVRLSYYSGETTAPEPLRSERSVMGVSPDGTVRASFLKYVGRIRSSKVRPVTVFNTWYDMQDNTLTEKNSNERMAALKTKLFDPFSLKLDSFVLDDGWDDRNTVWAIHKDRFGGDLTSMRQSLEQNGTRLGIWFGPIGGYDERALRIAAGRKEGYEVTSNGEYFCLAGPKYRDKFRNVVMEMVGKYRVNHFKFDGLPYGCNNPEHGHLLGVYSREAHLRAFIDLLQAIRAADPEIFLNITTSNWLSPWWLMYTDVVFMGGFDYGFLNEVPAVSERQKGITYRDKVLYDDFRRYEYQFPNSSLMTIGIIKGLLGAEGGASESLDDWTHNAIMNFSRGTMLTELYISPSMLSDPEWENLGRLMRWATDNSDVLLADTRFILGDPARAEVYGYSHFTKDRGIITLRNPTIEPRTVSVPLDRSSGVEPSFPRFQAKVGYPYNEPLPGSFGYGDSLPFTVQGYGVVVLELAADDSAFKALSNGVRPDAEGKTAYDPASAAVSGVRLLDLEVAGSSGAFTVAIPESTGSRRLALLCRPEGEGAQVSASLQLNGQDLKFTVVSPQSTEKGLGYGQGRWTFLVAEAPSGQSRVDFRISQAGGAPFSGELQVWLLADFYLAKRDLPAALQRPARAPLPATSEKEPRALHLFTRKM